MASSAAAIAGGVALGLLFAVIARVARRGLHPAIEGLIAGAAIAIATDVLVRRDIFGFGRDASWNGVIVAAALIAEYAAARALVRKWWPQV
jgi:hypothetical protein